MFDCTKKIFKHAQKEPSFTEKYKKGSRVLQVWYETPRVVRIRRGTITEVLPDYRGYAVIWDSIRDKEYLEKEEYISLSDENKEEEE